MPGPTLTAHLWNSKNPIAKKASICIPNSTEQRGSRELHGRKILK